MSDERLKVCVLGAGAAGLCATKYLSEDSKHYRVFTFEQTNSIAGTWVYRDSSTGLDEYNNPIHSSMYKNLRTNLPDTVMYFTDFPVNEAFGKCVSHEKVREYLESYAEHFNLKRHIEFAKKIEHVKVDVLDAGEKKTTWTVKIRCLKSNQLETRQFDAVMVCNGHYFEPSIPVIPGIECFGGTVMHSHTYRRPETYAGQTVVVLGAASSGLDIAIELTEHAAAVYLSHNNERFEGLPLKLRQVSGIERVDVDGNFRLRDGTRLNRATDVLMLCTGYLYSFPFLDNSVGITVDDNYVTPLYKHLINVNHPSMCIVGIPTTVVPFPMFQMQVQYFMSSLRGRVKLPGREEMLGNSAFTGAKKRHAHKLADKQWAYNTSLAEAGAFEPLARFYELAFDAWNCYRKGHLLNYKDTKLVYSRKQPESVKILPL